MRRREDFERVLAETLADGWSAELGRPVRLRSGAGADGQAWRFLPVFSAYVGRGAGPNVRRFLRESFQFTPFAWRAPIQWVVAQLLAGPAGLRLAGRSGFVVEPELPHEEERLVLPGNRRIRVFDFSSRRTRVFLKRGFPASAIRTEVSVRGGRASGPFQPILAAGETWFEEEIFDGVPLPRCAPWVDRPALARAALAALDTWLDRTARRADARAHVEGLVERCLGRGPGQGLPTSVHDALARAVLRLAPVASELGEVSLAVGHGDMQPGNVLAPRTGLDVRLIDWEYSAERWREFDRLTWALRARWGPGLAARLVAFVQGRRLAGLDDLAREESTRRRQAAMFLLEDLGWHVADMCSSPFVGLTEGLQSRLPELDRLVALAEGRA